jgi:hypothetical protein
MIFYNDKQQTQDIKKFIKEHPVNKQVSKDKIKEPKGKNVTLPIRSK